MSISEKLALTASFDVFQFWAREPLVASRAAAMAFRENLLEDCSRIGTADRMCAPLTRDIDVWALKRE